MGAKTLQKREENRKLVKKYLREKEEIDGVV